MARKKKDNKLVLAIVGVVIVALVAALVIFLLNGNDKKSDNEETTNTEVKKTKHTAKEIDLAKIPCGSVDFTIGTGTVTVEEISVHDKLGMLATALLELIEDEKLKTITAGEPLDLDIDIIEVAKQYFDVDEEMEKQIEKGFGTGFYEFSQKNGKATLNLTIGGCTPPMNEGYYVKYKGSINKDGTLVKTYYYYYRKNLDAIETDNTVLFPTSYYRLKGDAEPVYDGLTDEESITFDVFNTFDIYFDTSNGDMKLTKVVYNAE
jgi:hypothetical protein